MKVDAAQLMKVLLELDQQCLTSRPSPWGLFAELVRDLCKNSGPTFVPLGDWRSVDVGAARRAAPRELNQPTLDALDGPNPAVLSEDEMKYRAQMANTGGPRPGEVFRHYKGGLYVVVCRPIMEATHEPLVIYHSNRRATDWARTLDNFTETPPGLDQPRFRRVED